MVPYFKYLNNYEYSKDTTAELGKYCKTNFDKFVMSSSRECNKYGRYDYNYFLPSVHMPTELMSELGKHFKIKLTHEILGQSAFTDGKIHIDRMVPGVPPRVSLIFFPIYPLNLENVDPTNWYILESGSYSEYDSAVFKKQASADWTLGKPALINLQEYHCAQNMRNDLRFAAQFTTDKTFDEMIEIDNKGELYHAA
jgi:hypothetical protein